MELNLAKSETIRTLPDHLIMEYILPKLPLKTLHRFKFVCKSWLSEISSREFAKTLFKFSSLRPLYIGLCGNFFYKRSCYFFLSFNLESNSNSTVGGLVDYELPCTPEEIASVVRCCHGLVCLRYWKGDKLIRIWNPLTGQHYETHFRNDDGRSILLWGFGYALSTDDYKIVLITYGGVFVFSSRTGKWNMVVADVERHIIRYATYLPKYVLVGEILHWTPSVHHKTLVSFDFGCEKLVEEPSMEWLVRYDSVELANVEGCLACCGNSNADAVGVYDVWMLKRPKDWKSWEKLFRVDFGGIPVFCGGDIDSKILVYHLDLKRVTLVNLTPDGPEKLQGGVDFDGGLSIKSSHAWRYVKTLVCPWRDVL